MASDDPKSRYYARTMHTPDDPARAELRAALRELSKALIPLHRALIAAARADYAAAYIDVTPTQLLQLLGDHPFFAWLKPLTSLIVDIDEITRTDFAAADALALAERAERMFGAAPDADFSDHYVPILQRDVDVAVGHAAIRRAIGRLKS